MYFQKAIVEKEISYLFILCLLIYYNIAIEEDWSKYNSFHGNSFFPFPPQIRQGIQTLSTQLEIGNYFKYNHFRVNTH